MKEPDDENWGKLKHVMKYLHGTKKICLTFQADEIGIIKWYVDASYATHDNCRGHTGSIMTLGGGAVTSFSIKQCINTKSSTKAELIGVDEALPQILWTRYLLEEQGYAFISR